MGSEESGSDSRDPTNRNRIEAELDSWVRRRVRCFVWKQWKHFKRRVAELRKRGVQKDLAAQTASSSHGPWRISHSPALSYAMPKAFFLALGLPLLIDR